jgi:hypothetical protein
MYTPCLPDLKDHHHQLELNFVELVTITDVEHSINATASHIISHMMQQLCR